jgi:hypothetical protein
MPQVKIGAVAIKGQAAKDFLKNGALFSFAEFVWYKV